MVHLEAEAGVEAKSNMALNAHLSTDYNRYLTWSIRHKVETHPKETLMVYQKLMSRKMHKMYQIIHIHLAPPTPSITIV
jgi:hypothetical protein